MAKGKRAGRKGKRGDDSSDDDDGVDPSAATATATARATRDDGDGDGDDGARAMSKTEMKKARKAAKGKGGRGGRGRGEDSDEDLDPLAAAAKKADEEAADEGETRAVKPRKGKKTSKKGGFAALMGSDDDADDVDDASEEEARAAAAATKPKKEKKKSKKGGFAALMGSDDDVNDPLMGGGDDDDEEEEMEADVKPKKDKKKKSKKGGFAALMADDEDEDAEDDEEASESRTADTKDKKKKKKGSFADLMDADEEAAAVEVAIDLKKKKKKKLVAEPELVVGKIIECSKHPMADRLQVCTVDFGGDEPKRCVCGGANARKGLLVIFAGVGVKIPASGQVIDKTPLRGVMSEGMILSAVEMGWADSADGVYELDKSAFSIGDDVPLKAPGTTKKEKTPEPEPEPEPELVANETGGSKKDKKKKKKGGKQAADDEEDLDALLAELDIKIEAKPEEPAGESKAAKKRRLKAEREAAEAAAGGDAADAAPATDGNNHDDDDDGDALEDGKELSASQKKKLKKKQKEKEAKAKAAAEAEKKQKSAGAPSARILALQAEMQKRKEVEEAQAKAEAEARAAAEEAERLEKQKEEEEEARREAKKQKEKEKKERLRAEGKLLSNKQKAEQARLAAMRQQMLAKSGIDADKLDEVIKPKRPVYDDRKKKKEMEERRKQQQERAEAEAKAKAEEEARLAAEAEDDDAADDWEAEDWDDKEIILPGQKEEEERLAKEKAEKEAAEQKRHETEKKAAEAAAKFAAEKAIKAKIAAEKPWAKEAKEKAAAAKEAADASGSDEESDEGSGSDSGSDSDSDSDSDSSEYSDSSDYSEDSDDVRQREHEERMEAAKIARLARFELAKAKRSPSKLRCPIICIMGHVDTGKTKILDNIRRTNVQDGEAGGITQQIGATFIPKESLLERTAQLNKGEWDLRVPGLLVIDTPGHESFTNLRSRGSSLCDLAILVVDIMHGLEPQTIESLNMLRSRKTPFVIALNKIDRMYDWTENTNFPTQETLSLQKDHARREFQDRYDKIVIEFAEQGLNVAKYWENPDPRTFINIIPTSAITGEGMPDILQTLVDLCQNRMNERIQYVPAVQCTVLEVKMIEGLGTSVDVILINGKLKEGQTIVVAGLEGAITTQIRALLTPQPMREMRVKGSYIHHKEIEGAQGIKIVATGLEKAVAGTSLLVLDPEDDEMELREEVLSDMKGVLARVDKSGEGVYVQASTLGSLEALLEFLKSDAVKIPVAGIAIGPVNKRDVMGASVMHERKKPEYATILAFDVPVTKEAHAMGEELNVRIFTADIIYHLFDQFTAYMEKVKADKREAASQHVNFPCILQIMPNCVFNKRDPIVVGVDIVKGVARVGTQICIPSQGYIDIGKIASMELNHKEVKKATAGQSVAMKIEPRTPSESSRLYGRHFDHKDQLVSRMTRESIDMLKESFREELTKDDWRLVVALKTQYEKATGETI
jgi:translation initiation factor 5B